MEFTHFSRNGEIRPISEATVPLANIEYQYGFGVYETVRVKEGTAYFLDEHLARLIESARIIGLVHALSLDILRASVAGLIGKSGSGTYNLKILLIGGAEPSLFILPLNPYFPDKKLYRDGVNTVSVRYERMLPHAKTLNMLGSYLAYAKAKSSSAYDALLIDGNGNITEGTRTNFFCIKGKTLFSPPEEKILLGVTRLAVLKVAKEAGFGIVEKDIPLASLGEYDGAFLTSTSTGIVPIASVDGFRFPAPPAALKELMIAFDTFVEGSRGVLE